MFKSQLNTTTPESPALVITQIFEPGAGLWCIGQIAWSPWLHVHAISVSVDPTAKTVGASVSVAA
jgi:hypothetical protein